MSPADDPRDNGGFLSRWARRKHEAKVATRAEPGPEAAPSQPPAVQNVQPVQPQADERELPLPSLDDIVPGADVSRFFASHVPESLRTAALRKLWVTDPQIRDFIEMAENQWDFNNPDSIAGWSSKLDAADVKAMAARILNFGNPPEQRAEAEAEPPSSEPAEPPTAIGKNPESPTNPGGSTVPAEASEEAPEAHVAMQNNTLDSSVYAVTRKRHGGAMPS